MDNTAYEALRGKVKNLSEEIKKLKEEAARTSLNKKEIENEINLMIIPIEDINDKFIQNIKEDNCDDPDYAFKRLIYIDAAEKPVRVLLEAAKNILEQGLNLQETKGAMRFVADTLDNFIIGTADNDEEPE